MSKDVASPSRRTAVAPVAAPVDGFPTPPAAGLRLRLVEALERLRDGMDADLANGAGPALLAAVFASGIAVYFALPHEPSPVALAGVAAIGLAVATWRRRRGGRAIGTLVPAALVCGMTIAALATLRVEAPRLDRERTVDVVGRVIDLDATAKGGTRLELEVARMEGRGLPADSIPQRVTATLAAGRVAPTVGDAVALKARLKPPEGPVLPGGYDFARRAWFDGRGAGGYVLGRARPADLGPPSLLDRLVAPIGTLRHAIAERVRSALPGGAGAIGAALMVGEQRAIPESAAQPLRASGLTHIVSISGLHMSLVAGGVMVAIRLLLVAIPGVSLHRFAKKWAAVAAFLAATAYLSLSGMQVAALRSHLMVSVALLAVLVDRPAITMHTVAVAAMAILLVDPESAMEPSFQMSFLAVIALVASWDLWQIRVARRPPPRDDAGPVVHALGAAWRHAEGLAFSSLVAGLATAPVIVGVFYRGAPYSILANMLVLPVVGMVIMPAAVVAALAMPFGLDGLPLTVMGWGIDYMIAIGRWTAALPGGAGLVGAPHPLVMPLGVGAVLWLSLWRSRVRLFGIAPGVLAIVLAAAGPRPDVLVGRHGSPVAVRGDDGRLHVLAGRDERFDVAIWLAADADQRSPGDPRLAEGWRCDGLGCVFRRAGGDGRAALTIAVVREPRGFVEDCGRADVVISRLAAPPGCGDLGEVVDRPRQATTGALALTASGTLEVPAPARGAENASASAFDPTRDEGEAAQPEGEIASGAGGETVASSDEAGRVGDRTSERSASARGVPGRDAADEGREVRASADARDRPTASARLADEAGASGPRARPRFLAVAAHPAQARPWTPRDPSAERMAREVTAIRPEPSDESVADPASQDAAEGVDPLDDRRPGEPASGEAPSRAARPPPVTPAEPTSEPMADGPVPKSSRAARNPAAARPSSVGP